MNKLKMGLFLGTALLGTFSAEAGVTVCHKNGCQLMASYRPAQMMDSLNNMFTSDTKQIVFCEADPNTKECHGKPLSFMGRSNLMYTDMQIPFARLEQKKRDNMIIKLVLDYQLKANQFYPECTPSTSTLTLGLSWGGDIQMTSPLFVCRVTELGNTQAALNFQVDYVDLERNRLGGYYKVTVEGDILGGGTGYVVMQPSVKRAPDVQRPRPTSMGATVGQYTGEDIYEPEQNKTIFDWTAEDWKEKWDSFTDKFWKVLYLEPLDD